MAIIWKSLVSLLQHILHTPNITSYINFPELNIYLSLSGLSHYLSNLSLACQFLLNFPSHQKILILFVLFLLHSLFNSLLSYLLNFLLITFFFYNSSCVFSFIFIFVYLFFLYIPILFVVFLLLRLLLHSVNISILSIPSITLPFSFSLPSHSFPPFYSYFTAPNL